MDPQNSVERADVYPRFTTTVVKSGEIAGRVEKKGASRPASGSVDLAIQRGDPFFVEGLSSFTLDGDIARAEREMADDPTESDGEMEEEE